MTTIPKQHIHPHHHGVPTRSATCWRRADWTCHGIRRWIRIRQRRGPERLSVKIMYTNKHFHGKVKSIPTNCGVVLEGTTCCNILHCSHVSCDMMEAPQQCNVATHGFQNWCPKSGSSILHRYSFSTVRIVAYMCIVSRLDLEPKNEKHIH